MNVICRDTFIASSDTLVLQRENTMTGQTVNDKNRTIALLLTILKLMYTGEKIPKIRIKFVHE